MTSMAEALRRSEPEPATIFQSRDMATFRTAYLLWELLGEQARLKAKTAKRT
jgi:hypothetical protein